MATKKITDLTKLTDLDATDSFVVNDSGAGADKRVEFSDLQSEVLNGAAIGTSTAVTELQVDNLNLNGNTFSSTDTNGNVIIQPNGTGATIINESGAASDFRVEGDTDTDLLFVDASADRVGISTNAPGSTLDVAGTLAVSGDANFDSGTLFVDASEDKVGIGTTSPDELLTLPNDGTIALTTAGQSYIGSDTSDRSLNLMQYLKQDLSGGFLSTTALSRGRSYIKIDDGQIKFGTSGAQSVSVGGSITVSELLRITSSGYLRMASGSGGIQFGGDTAAANALDDYEEGTWTPVIDNTSGFDTVVSVNVSNYTKIGNVVYLNAEFNLAGSTGNVAAGDDIVLTTGSLPFTPASNGRSIGSGGIQASIGTGEDTAMAYVGMSSPGYNLGIIFHTVDGTVPRSNPIQATIFYYV